MRSFSALERIGMAPFMVAKPSAKRFPDGAEFRLEIPSVEGPSALAEVISAAAGCGVIINRVSQGSGGMLLTDPELRDMAALGMDAGMEVALFVGPRAGFGTGVVSRSAAAAAHYAAIRGLRQLGYAVEDVARAAEAGIRSFLVGDIGLLAALRELQQASELPADITWKMSAYFASTNASTLRVLEQLGAGTVNIAADVTLTDLAEMRAHVDVPIDLYLETPDSMGGIVRGHEIAEFVQVGAPLYVKMGLRNADAAYPSGLHTERAVIAAAREKVRRCALALEWLHRQRPGSVQSKPNAVGLAVPRPPASQQGLAEISAPMPPDELDETAKGKCR